MATGMRRRALGVVTVLIGLAALGVALLGAPDAVARAGLVAAPSAPGETAGEAPGAAPAGPPAVLARLPADTAQALVVDAPSAGAVTATVTGWRRAGGGWETALGPFPAHLGADGIGASSEDTKRTPAGTFGLTRAFGRAPDPGAALPYREVGADDWWVSDPASPAYNTPQTCARGTCPFDESRGENLDDAGHAYDHAVVIDANTAPVVRGAGSAYFLHVGDAPTAGCVAAAEGDVVATLRWLRPGAHPMISLGVRP